MRLSPFLKDVTTLSGGKIVATSIRILSIPVISRLFMPDVYGVAALYISIITILVTIGLFSLPHAIVLPDDANEATNLSVLSVLGLCLLGLIIWLLITSTKIINIEIFSEFGIWIWTIPVTVVLSGMIMIAESWMTRTRQFGISALGGVVQSMLTSGSRILIGMASGSVLWPLIGSYVLGLAGNILVYAKAVSGLLASVRFVTLRGLKKTLHEYRVFPIFNTPAALLFSLNGQLLILVLAYLYTPREVGQYAMVQALIVTMIIMVGESFRRAYLYRVTRGNVSKKSLHKDYIKACGLLAVVGLVPAAFLLMVGEQLFSFFLGQQWAAAGHYAGILSPWFFLQWVSMPAAALVIALKMQRFWLHYQLSVFVAQLAGITIAYNSAGDIYSILFSYVAVTSVLLMLLIAKMYYATKFSLEDSI